MAEPHAPYNKGYDPYLTRPKNPNAGINGWIENRVRKAKIGIHVIAIETSLSLSGSTGQSPMTRDFYARNFVQPFFTVECQAAGDHANGKIAEFVHEAQRDSVRTGHVMGLFIPGSGLKNTASGMRGRNSDINVLGFVRSMPRSHKRHEPAPEYKFDFVISRMVTGLFQDTPYRSYKLAKWSDIVDQVIQKNLMSPPRPDKEYEKDYTPDRPPLAPGANGEMRPT